MGELNNEIGSNVEVVKEKTITNAPDTQQFVKILGEDVASFLMCMREEID